MSMSVNTKAEQIFHIQSTYTINHTLSFQTHSGCWNRKPNWKKKKAGRQADDHYTDSTERML